MSRKTVAQMEVVILDRIEQSKAALQKLHQKHKLEIGELAYKHHLQCLSWDQLDLAFTEIAWKFCNAAPEN